MGRDDTSEGDAYVTPSDDDATADRGHLAGVDAGCGCVEVWEHLSERRAAEADGCADAAAATDD